MANFLTVKKQKMLIKSDFFYNKNDFKNQIIRRKNWIKNNPDLKADLEWNFMIKNIKIEKIKKIKLAYNFSKNLHYSHPGLNSKNYFYHPLRVCLLSRKIINKLSSNLMILCLLHNIFENTDIDQSIVSKIFGTKITDQLLILTVDRKNEWGKNYKKKYYSRICKSGKNVIITKVLDKLDNLYLLRENKNLKIKKRYLKEIEEFIMPMIKKEMKNKNLYLYFKYLINYSKKIVNINFK
jgi:(p)ppGpp synthase/HD superfamily hydrolase